MEQADITRTLKSAVVYMRLEPSLRKRLEALAKKEGLSVAALCRAAIRAYLGRK